MMVFGLLDRDVYYILAALRKFPEIERVIIFGSRALGNYKKGSDIDLVLIGEGITNKTIYEFHDLLSEEYPLPYFFDIVLYHQINNEKLLEHIDKYGIEIYRNSED
jgi:predicted nucleotidyltransferase